MGDIPECSIDRIHIRLDEIREAIEAIRISHATYAGRQERAEQDVSSLRDTVAKVSVYVEQYRGDRKFVLGIIACIAAFNGLGYKLATNYLDEMNEGIKAAKREASLNAAEIAALRDDISRLPKHLPSPVERK